MSLPAVRRVAPFPRRGAIRARGGLNVFAVNVRSDISCLLAVGLAAWTFAETILPRGSSRTRCRGVLGSGHRDRYDPRPLAGAPRDGPCLVRAMGRSRAAPHFALAVRGVTVFDREPETPRAACQVALAALAAILAHVALVECDADPLAAGVAASAAVINADRIRRRRPQTDRGAALAFARARAVAAGVAAPRNFASGQAAGSVSRASTPPLAGAASVRVPPCRRAIRSTVTSPIPVRPGF